MLDVNVGHTESLKNKQETSMILRTKVPNLRTGFIKMLTVRMFGGLLTPLDSLRNVGFLEFLLWRLFFNPISIVLEILVSQKLGY